MPSGYEYIIGVLVPVLVQLTKGWQWSKLLKTLFALGVSLLVGLATAWLQGNLNWQDAPGTIGIIMALAMGSYKLYWEKAFDDVEKAMHIKSYKRNK